jgi:uncharacterized protein (DUF433 family)
MATVTITHLESTPDICGGKPRIQGRRLTVHFLATFLNDPEWTADKLAAAYDLTPAQVYAAWSYYYDHKDEIDAELQAEQDMLESVPSFREEMERRETK